MRIRHCISDHQKEWLINNYPNLGILECSKYLNVPPETITNIAFRLKLKVTKERRHKAQTENGKKYAEKHTKYHLNKEQIEWFKENYPLLGMKKCSEFLSVPLKYTTNLAVKMGVRVNKNTTIKNKSGKIPHNKKYSFNQDQIEWIKINYPIYGSRKCSEFLGVPMSYLNNWAAKKKIYVSRETKAKRQSESAITYQKKTREKAIEESKSIKISTPEQAYSLGFLWGDGYLINRKDTTCCYPYLGIQREDFDKIIKTFFSLGNWKIHYRKTDGRKEQGESILFDRKLGYFLERNDYKLKSFASSEKILSLIPENINLYWWRGYIDADGCFYINKTNHIYQFSLAGSYNQNWSEFEKLLNSLEIRYSIKRRVQNEKSKGSIVSVSNKGDIVKLGNYIYKENLNIGLNRKYQKFLMIKEAADETKTTKYKVLQLYRQGKTIKEISIILSLKEPCVRSHIKKYHPES